MEFALHAQREEEGLISSHSLRETAAKGMAALIADYENDLVSRRLARKHVHDTLRRIRRIVSETGWRGIADIRPDSFLTWRSSLESSAKTKKEYQISINAILNWLVRTDRFLANPLVRIKKVETRGKQVRQYRAFTVEELARLFSIAGKRRLAYQTLLYTGQRKSEVRALVWGDLHLDSKKPYILFREGTTKDKDKRAVALRLEIAEELRAIRPVKIDPTVRVFWFAWPTYDILRSDFKRAAIERKDGLGRVVHFHSFRKTFQTLGVGCGINQRAAQEILGHSDANNTARVYTDVASLQLHDEIAKLPWISPTGVVAQHSAQNSGVSRQDMSLADILSQLIQMVKVTGGERVGRSLASSDTPMHFSEIAARAGIEPATRGLQPSPYQCRPETRAVMLATRAKSSAGSIGFARWA